MFVLVLQLAFLIISTIYVFKTAKSNGHSVVLWTLLNIVGFLIAPFVLSFLFAVLAGLASSFDLVTYETAVSLATIFGWVTLGFGIACTLLILRKVSELNEEAIVEAPPEPGFFDLK